MQTIIDKLIVLKLNKAWQTVGHSTVGRAIVDLAAGQAAMALDIVYNVNDEGDPIGDPISMNPVSWDEWIELPVRSYDFCVHYANGNKTMRVPTVLIAKNFNRMPVKRFKGKPSKDGIWYRDNGVDQYTGKKLKRDEATIDHVEPKSKGGKDTWENLVVTHKKINSDKGNKSNSEAGLTLIRKPIAPNPIPISSLIREAKHRDWRPFLQNIDE